MVILSWMDRRSTLFGRAASTKARPRLDCARLGHGVQSSPVQSSPVQSSPVFVCDQNDNDREPIPVQMVVSRLSFGLFDRDSIAIEPQLNNQQRTSLLVSVDFHGVQSQYNIEELNPLRMVVLASIGYHFSDYLDFDYSFHGTRQQTQFELEVKCNAPTPAQEQPSPSAATIALALGFDRHNQTRSSIRFE